MIHLTRIDAARNMARFCRLDLQADLFGGATLTREGRTGQAGTLRIDHHENEATAQRAAAKIMTSKQRRGYRLSDVASRANRFPRQPRPDDDRT